MCQTFIFGAMKSVSLLFDHPKYCLMLLKFYYNVTLKTTSFLNIISVVKECSLTKQSHKSGVSEGIIGAGRLSFQENTHFNNHGMPPHSPFAL